LGSGSDIVASVPSKKVAAASGVELAYYVSGVMSS